MIFIFIVLFLLSSLLVSIVICRNNRYCVNILFAGYIAAIIAMFFAMIMSKHAAGLWNIQPIKVQIMDYESDIQFDEQSKIFIDYAEQEENAIEDKLNEHPVKISIM